MIHTSFYTGIGTIIAQISGLVVTKIIAITLGTAGIAMISQFIDFISISTSAATGGIQAGVVKYIAEYKKNEKELAKILSTSFRVTLLSSVFFGATIYIFSSSLSNYLFKTPEYQYVLTIFAFNIVLFSLNTLIIKILNGLREIKKMVIINISNSLFELFITATATYFYGIDGALIALSIAQSIIFFISLSFVLKSAWFKKSLFNIGFDKKNVMRLLAFTLMGICNMVLSPIVNIGIRNYIVTHLSMQEAGIWSGMVKISNSYLSIFTITLAYYYLPKLSETSNKFEIRKIISQGQKIILPFLIIVIIALFFLREYVILLIYSQEFINMKYLFAPQLIGDFFKITTFLVTYLILAKAMTKLFIISSLVIYIFTYLFTILMIHIMSLEGAVYAYAIKNFLVFIIMTYLLREFVYAKSK